MEKINSQLIKFYQWLDRHSWMDFIYHVILWGSLVTVAGFTMLNWQFFVLIVGFILISNKSYIQGRLDQARTEEEINQEIEHQAQIITNSLNEFLFQEDPLLPKTKRAD